MVRTVLKAYTAFEGTHPKQDLASITGLEPTLNADVLEQFRTFCKKEFWPKVVGASPKGKALISNLDFKYQEGETPYVSFAAGPNCPVSFLGVAWDTLAWVGVSLPEGMTYYKYHTDPEPVHPISLVTYLQAVGETRTLDTFWKCVEFTGAECTGEVEPERGVHPHLSDEDFTSAPSLTRIHLIKEPAGKVRPIAIADYWTQRALYPLHKWMMDVLRSLPSDCTFDQEGGLRDFSRVLQVFERTKVHSIDLKSATDLIPITLYRTVFDSILPGGLTEKWIDLLRNRDFLVLPQEKGLLDFTKVKSNSRIRYGRGQPMGALTSWPSMAIVHHALVLFAAYVAKHDPVSFALYRVLGDDVVIGDDPTADAYLVHAEALQVPISLAKTHTGELYTFASQALTVWGDNVSNLSLSEELGVGSFAQRLEFALRAIRRGWLKRSGTVSLGKFLRHLLTRKAYKASVKEFAKGKLGTMAQAALVTSVSVAGKILSELNVSQEGSGTFLLALANKVTALAQDSTSLARKIWKSYADIQVCFALVALREAHKAIEKERETYNTHFEYLLDLLRGLKVDPVGTIQNWAQVDLDGPPPMSRMEAWRNPQILNLLIRQHWTAPPTFAKVSKLTSTRSFGRTSGVVKLKTASPKALSRQTSAFDEALVLTRAKIAELTNMEEVEGRWTQSPWDLVDEVTTAVAKLPRLPDFSEEAYFIQGVKPTPVEIALQRQWVRKTRAYAELMRYVHLNTDFILQAADITGLDSVADLQRSSLAALTPHHLQTLRVWGDRKETPVADQSTLVRPPRRKGARNSVRNIDPKYPDGINWQVEPLAREPSRPCVDRLNRHSPEPRGT